LTWRAALIRLMNRMGIRMLIRSAGSHQLDREISYPFEQARIVIGRGAGVDVRLPDRTVSAHHATVELRGDEYHITDNGSTNGTRVNGVALITGRARTLREGDIIEVGGYRLSTRIGPAGTDPVSAERTAELARRLLREARFSGSAPVPLPRLTVMNGPTAGERLEIAEPPQRLVVGRGEACQLVLPDADISRKHLEVIRDLDGVLVRNLDSKNGVLIGEQRITERRLRSGTELVLGDTRIVFEDPAEESIRAMEGRPDVPQSSEGQDPAPVRGAGNDAPETGARPESAAAVAGLPARFSRGRDRTPVPAGAELLIYLLAAVIVILSIAGLFILLRAS
jgi:pSer/pThr/pTyr-binding forkhead associated (FHA) protein